LFFVCDCRTTPTEAICFWNIDFEVVFHDWICSCARQVGLVGMFWYACDMCEGLCRGLGIMKIGEICLE
jgi:hypothetical protein